MFAGPNGSGKTTVKNGLGRPDSWLGLYFNPDEIEKSIQTTGQLSVKDLRLPVSTASIQRHFSESSFLAQKRPDFDSVALQIERDAITFSGKMDSYIASVMAGYLRRVAMEAGASFSFETVMSSRDKVELLADARTRGYRTYLYFIATEDPEINVSRVAQRVSEGGHDVPAEKVVSRYHRSISLLGEAIKYVNRGFLFDTSSREPWYFGETTDGKTINLKDDVIPAWFGPIWETFDKSDGG